jgi:hypothetical protein
MSTTQDALSPSAVPASHRGRWIIGAVVAVLIIFVIACSRGAPAGGEGREGGPR